MTNLGRFGRNLTEAELKLKYKCARWKGFELYEIKPNVWFRYGGSKNHPSSRRYFIKTQCNVCGKTMYKDKSNARKGHKAACSKNCQYNHKSRLPFVKRPRSNGEYHVLVHMPNHPKANRHGLVYEHRIVMEKSLGRFLLPQERVHHINMVKHDNRPENLYVFKNNTEHFKAHGSLNKIVAELIREKIIKFDVDKKVYVTDL